MKHYTIFYKGLPLVARFDDSLYMCVEDNAHYIVYNECDNHVLAHVKHDEAWGYMFEKSNEYGFYTEDVNECMKYLAIC